MEVFAKQASEVVSQMFVIKDWDRHFENAASRKIKNCSYVCVPNRESMRLKRLLAAPGGFEAFGLFILLVEICSRHPNTELQKRRGYLTERGTPDSSPYTIDDLATMCTKPAKDVARWIDILKSDKIGWVLDVADGTSIDDPASADDNEFADADGEEPAISGEQSINLPERSIVPGDPLKNSAGDRPILVLEQEEVLGVCDSARPREDGQGDVCEGAVSGWIAFKRVYPANGSVVSPTAERNFAAAVSSGVSPMLIVQRAKEYGEYCRARDPASFPHVPYIKQADNWLYERKWEINWKSQRKALERGTGEPSKSRGSSRPKELYDEGLSL